MKIKKYKGKDFETGEWIIGELIQVGNRCFIRDGNDKYNLRAIANGYGDFRFRKVISESVESV